MQCDHSLESHCLSESVGNHSEYPVPVDYLKMNSFFLSDCGQMSSFGKFQFPQGSLGWSPVYSHLQTERNLERSTVEEEEVSFDFLLGIDVVIKKMIYLSNVN